MEINKEQCFVENSEVSNEGIIRKSILPNEIEELDFFSIDIEKDRSFRFVQKKNRVSIFLMTHGIGSVQQGEELFKVNEISVFIPSALDEVAISAASETLGMLEIVLEIPLVHQDFMEQQRSKFPYFLSYSQCKQYKESIKSEKTINRILLPEDIIPRFCMGSVHTDGPDEVGVHTHPMLEQFFFGLDNNNCIVVADGVESLFKNNTLLHIPLGSEHGVKVEQEKILNYIWMDFFHSQSDMDYIRKNHLTEEE